MQMWIFGVLLDGSEVPNAGAEPAGNDEDASTWDARDGIDRIDDVTRLKMDETTYVSLRVSV